MRNIEKAVALAYDENNIAPKVVAKGKGIIANEIIAKARQFNVPLFENEILVNTLLNIDIDEEIPPSIYYAVIEVFVWLAKTEELAEASR